MPGLLRKFASAFVVLEKGSGGAEGQPNPNFDEITKDSSQLLAQLEGAGESATFAQGGESSAAGASAMAMTAEDVFQANNLIDGPNASPRLLKLIAGINMFDREQQLA